MSVNSIKRSEIADYIEPPPPFSGKRRAINPDGYYADIPIVGLIGNIEVMYCDEGYDL